MKRIVLDAFFTMPLSHRSSRDISTGAYRTNTEWYSQTNFHHPDAIWTPFTDLPRLNPPNVAG